MLGLLIASLVLPILAPRLKNRLIRWWCGRLLAAFNLKVKSYGHIPSDHINEPVILVANHISWSDIHALNSIVPIRFIAKAEIRDWPIFGYLVSKANTLFIDRSIKRDAKRTLDSAVASLLQGDKLCFFPEGTTTDGSTLMRFKSSLIQAAIEAKATIHPVAIRYPDEYNQPNIQIAYAGETTLTQSMSNVLMQRQPLVELHFLDPILPEEALQHDRRSLTLEIERRICRHLGLKTETINP